jgi:hypothetical protein
MLPARRAVPWRAAELPILQSSGHYLAHPA